MCRFEVKEGLVPQNTEEVLGGAEFELRRRSRADGACLSRNPSYL
jgi:hypothetical protein